MWKEFVHSHVHVRARTLTRARARTPILQSNFTFWGFAPRLLKTQSCLSDRGALPLQAGPGSTRFGILITMSWFELSTAVMALKAQTKAVFGGYLTLHLDRGAGAWGEGKKKAKIAILFISSRSTTAILFPFYPNRLYCRPLLNRWTVAIDWSTERMLKKTQNIQIPEELVKNLFFPAAHDAKSFHLRL